ncbi:hypothetical protein LUZ60_005994 [Juncus effusus]|nr:hypothetical protein LUZ60_005994 [Juncus effusus]
MVSCSVKCVDLLHPFYSSSYPSKNPEPIDKIWEQIREEARSDLINEPILRNYYCHIILCHFSLESSLAAHLASKLHIPNSFDQDTLEKLFFETLNSDSEIRSAIRADLSAAFERDPACTKMAHCFLYYKGFLALQVYRIAHHLISQSRFALAYLLQSRCSEVFQVDIHPGAKIGKGILLDHATGVVIGETAVVGDNVAILHGVTLGGTGKEAGMDRHPKVGDGVLIGAGASVLGNVRIGDGAKIGAGAVVVKMVPAGGTAVGTPAKVVEGKRREPPAVSMDHLF